MELHKITHRLDRFGIAASALCAVHCAAVPLLITLLPLWGLSFLAQTWIELVMIGIAILLGVTSLGLSYYKYHRNLLPLLILAGGFGLIALGHLAAHPHPYPDFYIYGQQAYRELHPLATDPAVHKHTFSEIWVVPAGGLFVVAAHLLNWHLTRKHRHCRHVYHR